MSGHNTRRTYLSWFMQWHLFLYGIIIISVSPLDLNVRVAVVATNIETKKERIFNASSQFRKSWTVWNELYFSKTTTPPPPTTTTTFNNNDNKKTENNGINDRLVGERAHDLFGWSAAMSRDGSTVAIGAIDYDPKIIATSTTNGGSSSTGLLSAAGQVRIYQLLPLNTTRNNNTHHQQQHNSTHQFQLQPVGVLEGTNAGDYMGYSVSLSQDGTTVAIGSPGYKDGSGKVSIHAYNPVSSRWVQKGQSIDLEQFNDKPPRGLGVSTIVGAGVGHVVALSSNGNTIVAGAPYYDNNRGLVLVMHYASSTQSWEKESSTTRNIGNEQELQPPWSLVGDTSGAQFGYSVAISAQADVLAVGAKNHPGPQPIEQASRANWATFTRGQVQVFQRTTTTTTTTNNAMKEWALVAPPIYGRKLGDFFGFSLSFTCDGSILAIGSPYYDHGALKDAGLVQVYQVSLANKTDDETVENDDFKQHLNQDAQTNDESSCSSFHYKLVPLGQDILLDNGHAEDCFGYSVALSDDGLRLAIGSRQAKALAGLVKLYDLSKIISNEDDVESVRWQESSGSFKGEEREQAGFSLALSGRGNLLIFGSPYHGVSEASSRKSSPLMKTKTNAGMARIFHATNNPAQDGQGQATC